MPAASSGRIRGFNPLQRFAISPCPPPASTSRPRASSISCRSARSSIGSIRASFPFRKATQCQIHVSGGEFNVAANLADCFRLKTGVATAMVDYPIGDLIAERVRAMGVQAVLQALQARRRHRPEHGHRL